MPHKQDIQVRAGDEHIGQVNESSNYVDITMVMEASILADGDVAANMVEIPGAVRNTGGRAVLESFVLLDGDDQKIAADIVFSTASTDLGTLNSAPNISDANAANVLGIINVATGDYADIGGISIATKRALGLGIRAAASSTSIYVGIITRGGTPTYTASGVKMRFFFSRRS